MTPERVCTRCGESYPIDGFRWIIQPRTKRRVRAPNCKLCSLSAMLAGLGPHREAVRKSREKEIHCRKCGKIKPPTDFPLGRNGVPNSPCKNCRRITVAEFRRSERGRLHNRNALRKARDKRYRLRRGDEVRKEWRDSHPELMKARGAIRTAVKGGKVKKPRRCQACGKNCEQRKLDVFFLAGLTRPFEHTWLCRLCKHQALAATRRGDTFVEWFRARKLERQRINEAKHPEMVNQVVPGGVYEVPESLAVSHEEFEEIHQERVAQLARERRNDPLPTVWSDDTMKAAGAEVTTAEIEEFIKDPLGHFDRIAVLRRNLEAIEA